MEMQHKKAFQGAILRIKGLTQKRNKGKLTK